MSIDGSTAREILERIQAKQREIKAKGVQFDPTPAAAEYPPEDEDCCDYCRDVRLEQEEIETEIQTEIRMGARYVEWAMQYAGGLASDHALEESPEAVLKLADMILRASTRRAV